MSTPAQTPAVPDCPRCKENTYVHGYLSHNTIMDQVPYTCERCDPDVRNFLAPLPIVAELARQRDEYLGWLRALLREWLHESKRTQPFKNYEWHIDAVGSYFGIPPEVVRAILGTDT